MGTEANGRVRRPPWWRPAVVPGAVGAAFLGLVVAPLYLAYIDWPARPDPLPLQIEYGARDNPDLTGTSYVYSYWSDFIDSEYLWRIEAGPDLLPLLVRDLGVLELQPGEPVTASFWKKPPYWWTPRDAWRRRFFMSPGFDPVNRGQDGTHYLLMYDAGRGVLYAWVKNNF